MADITQAADIYAGITAHAVTVFCYTLFLFYHWTNIHQHLTLQGGDSATELVSTTEAAEHRKQVPTKNEPVMSGLSGSRRVLLWLGFVVFTLLGAIPASLVFVYRDYQRVFLLTLRVATLIIAWYFEVRIYPLYSFHMYPAKHLGKIGYHSAVPYGAFLLGLPVSLAPSCEFWAWAVSFSCMYYSAPNPASAAKWSGSRLGRTIELPVFFSLPFPSNV